MAAHDTTITELLLAASRADYAELWHQRVCRARGAGLGCAACDEYAADVLATDVALRNHFQAMCEGAA